MIKISSLRDAQVAKHNTSIRHRMILKRLCKKLYASEQHDYKSIICQFIISHKLDDQSLLIYLGVMEKDKVLKDTLVSFVKSMEYNDLSHIMNVLVIEKKLSKDAIDRLYHATQLSEFWSQKASLIPFNNIIPVNIIINFLKNFDRSFLYKKSI